MTHTIPFLRNMNSGLSLRVATMAHMMFKNIFSLILVFCCHYTWAQQSPKPRGLQEQNQDQKQHIESQNKQSLSNKGVYIDGPPSNDLKKEPIRNERAIVRQRELEDLLKDMRNSAVPLPKNINPPSAERFKLADTNAQNFKEYAPKYNAAYGNILEMLEGKDSLNLKKAVWLSESALSGAVSYEDFSALVAEAVAAARYIISKENLNPHNSDHIHLAIRKLYNDTLSIISKSSKQVFYPYKYDFNDPMGDLKTYNYTVAKLLKTHKGQCHSMPLLYMILAQELGVENFLSYTPLHSFVQYYSKDGYLNNFETTNGHLATRDYYMASGFVKAEAIKNGIYLKSVNKKQVIATLLIDLGNYYQQHFGYSDFQFRCCRQCFSYFPTYISAQLLYEKTFTAYTLSTAKAYNYPPRTEIYKYPRLKEIYDELLRVQKVTDESGYEPLAKETYDAWVNPKKGK